MITIDIVVALVLLLITVVLGGWAMLRFLVEWSNCFKWYDYDDKDEE